jgi:integrase
MEGQQMPANTNLRLVAPDHENRTVMPVRPPNAALRSREHLTPTEVDKLIGATKGSRYPQRDMTLILVLYRHGLRAQECADLEWSQIDFSAATMHVRRVKNGKPSSHPIRGDELRALRQLKREQEPASPFVFTSERGSPFTTDALNRLVKRLGEKAELGPPIHVHMLRHACGYPLSEDFNGDRPEEMGPIEIVDYFAQIQGPSAAHYAHSLLRVH